MNPLQSLTFPLYQPIETPDFDHCSAQQPCRERYDLMWPHIYDAYRDQFRETGSVSLMDAGCHTGWFCRRFSRAGIRTIGIDRSPEWLAAAIELHPDGDYRSGNVEEMELPQVDIALCLSVAMYFERPEATFLKLSESTRRLFLDFGGQYATSMPFDEASALSWMLKNTVFTCGSLIGRSSIHRPLFMFTR